MKLKFRADAKDIKIFIVFAILLFYLVAIAILNITSFINDASFHGFNPFPIFTAELFPPTIIFYFAILIMIMLSVKSYFFDREKGIGVATGKKDEKGYSRWCKDKEMKKAPGIVVIKPTDDNIPKGGIPIYNDGKQVWIDTGGYHNMIIGSTGSGKSQALAFPFINVMAKAGESMIITDPKGELYTGTAKELKKRGYNIILLNFREPQKGNCWNPYTVPYRLFKAGNIDKSIELLDDLSKNILYDENNKGQDPFWEQTSSDYFSGLSLCLFKDAKEEEVNINSINYMANVGDQKINGTNYMRQYFSTKDPTSTESTKVQSTITAPAETKGSILAVFYQKIQLFSSRKTLSEMLSRSDFDMEDIGRKKTAVFIVVQDEKTTYHSLVTIFLKQCYETLIRVAQENPDGKLKYRTNFLLDEFANMPPLSDVGSMVSAARSRNIRLSFIIQNFSQLNDVYGKEVAETLRGNCGNLIYLLSTEIAALEEISKMCGEVKSKKEDKTDSRPLVTVSDLQNFKEEEALILRSRMRPFKSKLKFDYKIEWGMSKEKEDYPVREPQPLQIFDLKKVVDEQIKERRKKMYGDMDSVPTPFGGSMPPGFPPIFNRDGLNGGSGMPGPRPTNQHNVDDMMKKIDAKIAELEKEEQLEKEKARKQAESKPKPVPAKPQFDMDRLLKKIDERIAEIEEEEKAANKHIVEEAKTSKTDASAEPVVREKEVKTKQVDTKNITTEEIPESIHNEYDEDYITDDQFFDDFFYDDE